METPIIREEVEAYLQACITFEEFSRYNELTTDELEAIESLSQALGLTLYRTPPSNDLPLTDPSLLPGSLRPPMQSLDDDHGLPASR
jgi:hypothetical protein